MRAKRRRLIATLQQEPAKERLRSYSTIRRVWAKSSAVYQSEPEMGEGVDAKDPRFSGVTDWPSPMRAPSASNSAADKPVPPDLRHRISYRMPSRRSLRGTILRAATRVFSGPGTNPAPDLSSLPAGPSEFTRIISGGIKRPIPSELPAESGAQPGPSPNMSVVPRALATSAPVPMSGCLSANACGPVRCSSSCASTSSA